ncbi:MAG: 30S ribosomal protein S16 [Planctomycetes bacterium]|nr:30S ribosomal protein S16 [Planctomycetota bacterium]
MKQMGRKHRPFYRICAVDSRSPRDGKVIEELGTYDPKVPDVDARVVLDNERVAYWLGTGAKPSEHVAVFIKKYGPKGIRLKEQEEARARLSMPKIVPPAPEAVFVYEAKQPEAPAAEAPVAEAAAPAEASAEPAAEAAAEAPAAE